MHTPDQSFHNRIPISVSFAEEGSEQQLSPQQRSDKKRLLYISGLAICVAILISLIAKLLVALINLITNLSFHQSFSAGAATPLANNLGAWVIFVPAIGGLIVGLMALYGSKAIRGHGIPEAMEQILTNQSKIRPSITYLKPLSSAISIGTGGPFGAEGPIIATGGALGSTLGQILRISPYERKVLLTAGATAGMAAIFGSPIAAVFLAIELLLFEFSPRSILPVALACITGAAGHHLLFEAGPVFPAPMIAAPSNSALLLYSVMGILIGVLSAGVTKLVYFIEDAFEHLPIHWMWWPAIGGVVVGVVGYFAPRTLGVGYQNITELLSGQMTMQVVLSLCFFKFISWSVALGSGTSGGTLAPLLTIGAATGILLGTVALQLFPEAGVALPLAALVGMSALFAGASRALLTSIVFAVETTGQSNALLPLLAACLASYGISYLLMKNTIMTEKIARRGVATPSVYEPDVLNNFTVQDVLQNDGLVISYQATLAEVREWLQRHKQHQQNYYVIADDGGRFQGLVSSSNLFSLHHAADCTVGSLIRRKPFLINSNESLRTAVELMARENVDVLPVKGADQQEIIGVLSYQNILTAYRLRAAEHEENIAISIRRRTLKILLHGKKRLSTLQTTVKE